MRPFYRPPVGRMRSSLPQDSLLPISRQMLEACRLAALKVSMRPRLVKSFDFMFQVSRLLSSKETTHLPSCVWSAMVFEGMHVQYPICYSDSLPLTHPITPPHLMEDCEDADGESTDTDGAELDTSSEGSVSGGDSGMEVDAVAPPPISTSTTPSSPPASEEEQSEPEEDLLLAPSSKQQPIIEAAANHQGGQSSRQPILEAASSGEVDWQWQWAHGLLQPPAMDDKASG